MSEIDDLKNKQTILSGWLNDFQDRAKQMAYVQQSLDMTNYQIDVVSGFPAALPMEAKLEILDSFNRSTAFWGQFVTAYPKGDTKFQAASGLAIETSGSNVANIFMSSMTVGNPPEVQIWAQEKISIYEGFEQVKNRDNDVRKLLADLLPKQLAEYEVAGKAFVDAISGAQPQSTWAIHARNAMEHINGELFDIARKVRRTRGLFIKKIKWPEVAEVLAKGGVGSAEHSALLAERSTYDTLHGSLTTLAKNLARLSEADFRTARTQYQEHLFAELSFLDDAIIKANR